MTYSDLRKGVQARRVEDEDRATMLQAVANLDYVAMVTGIDLDDDTDDTEDATEDTTETDTETTTEED